MRVYMTNTHTKIEEREGVSLPPHYLILFIQRPECIIIDLSINNLDTSEKVSTNLYKYL